MRRLIIGGAVLLAAALGVAAYFLFIKVAITDYPVPVREGAAPPEVHEESVLVTSVGIPLRTIQRGLEQDIPRQLWSIDRKLDECVPRKQISILGQDITKTPKIGCTLRGSVKRGPIIVTGRGDRMVARFPVDAIVRAEDVGGIIKRETATGRAFIEVSARFLVSKNWQAGSDVEMSYRWTKEPGIDFLGQRIRFTGEADKELQPIIEQIERNLERQIEALDIKSQVASLWKQGFMVESLNRENPPVWLRLEPQQVGVGAFRVQGGRMSTRVMLQADTQILVGDKPDTPVPTPLGRNAAIKPGSGFRANIPVFADYAELEPVILRALQNLAKDGIKRDGLGSIEAKFRKVTLYPTSGGRIAVGIEAEVQPIGEMTGKLWKRGKGEIWLTAKPITREGSEVLSFDRLEVYGNMDSLSGDLLLRVMSTDEVTSAIERALVEDFQSDYDDVLAKARKGLESVAIGKSRLSLTVNTVKHGQVIPTSKGLFLPLAASGDASFAMNEL